MDVYSTLPRFVRVIATFVVTVGCIIFMVVIVMFIIRLCKACWNDEPIFGGAMVPYDSHMAHSHRTHVAASEGSNYGSMDAPPSYHQLFNKSDIGHSGGRNSRGGDSEGNDSQGGDISACDSRGSNDGTLEVHVTKLKETR